MADHTKMISSEFSHASLVTQENKREHLTGKPLFFRIACNLVLQMRYGTVLMVLPEGSVLKFEGQEERESIGIIHIHNFAFARRLILGGDIGFYESFADDEWSTPDLADCLYVFARNADLIQRAFEGHPVFAWIDWIKHSLNKNTKTGSKKNILAHYDLGNCFYEQWLDPGMTYSSALYSRNAQNLEAAQKNKYINLANALDLKSDENLLEIGSGWGGFAEFAAKDIGANVTSITISEEQYDYARQRIFREGLNEKVKIRLRDYRDVNGQFDKVASIEMFEAVGQEYWASYFDKISSVLRPGGKAGLQVITISDRFFESYSKSADFIQRYVFPGGMLPSPSILQQHVQTAGLKWNGSMQFGQHYANTLNDWHTRFLKAWSEIKPLGFDQHFKKTWQFYLAYCEAGFRAATTDVYQISISKA